MLSHSGLDLVIYSSTYLALHHLGIAVYTRDEDGLESDSLHGVYKYLGVGVLS